jgi:hypothetical protein
LAEPLKPEAVSNLAERFQRAAIPKEQWTHAAHLAVGAWHVHHAGAEEALERLRSGIVRLNEACGIENSEASGYHETVTRAYVLLIAEFLSQCPQAMPLEQRVERLLLSPLAEKKLLLEWFSRELLLSPRARAEWVEPDRGPLPRRPMP